MVALPKHTSETGKGLSDMTTIRATCGTCGDVELTTADVSVMIHADDGEGSYSFRCPLCRSVVVKPSPRHTIDLLVSAGVRYSMWSSPEERITDPSAPAFTHDDLLEFHVLLEDDSRLSALLESM